MKKTLMISAAAMAAFGIATVWAQGPTSATAPKAAPAFSLQDATGKTVNLADFKGKYVVLEWWNYQCPYVVRHYNTGNIPGLQKRMTGEGVVWLSINSSAPGKQGHVAGASAIDAMKKTGGVPSHVLLDHNGTVGKMYDAKTTPQMVLISPKGELLYNGGIDNAPRARTLEDAQKAENWLVKAYSQHKAGQPITNPAERPYGCDVKY